MGSSQQMGTGRAVRTVVGVFGLLAALAGMEHGLGEILQGPVAPDGVMIRSWPGHEAFETMGGEPAMTLIPNLLVSGVLTIVVSAVFAVWAVTGVQRRRGSMVLIGLSLLLLAVGGGFGPPLLGVILGVGASGLVVPSRTPGGFIRVMARIWPWALGAGVAGYLGLVPGTLLLHTVSGPPPM
ncbi:hypothetical protein, partial [Arthrobacter sp. HMWF013]|uniref:hypothetical protein n=1 Tax=Arthrobacter sp. HMWF013 TaxID=2056849 RepID=UPI000D38ACEE